MTDDDLIRLGRELNYREPPRGHVEEMRTAVLASMKKPALPVGNHHRTRWLAGGCAVAAAAAAAIWIAVPDTSVRKNHGTVTPIGEARFAVVGNAPDEVVRMTDGIVHVEVSPLHAGERFRVRTADGEVEVRGTAFDIEAHHDLLERVTVTHGRVEVRIHHELHVLNAGDQWAAPTVAIAPAPPVPAPPVEVAKPTPPPALIAHEHHHKVVPETTPTPSTETMFREGWDALQRGDTSAAADAFDRVVTAEPKGSLAEDAEFWRATALSRAHKTTAARAAYQTFLSDFPHSLRAGEAAAMLGWMLVDANDLDAAEAQFTRASGDAVPRVRASAEAGLAEVAKRRKPH